LDKAVKSVAVKLSTYSLVHLKYDSFLKSRTAVPFLITIAVAKQRNAGSTADPIINPKLEMICIDIYHICGYTPSQVKYHEKNLL